MTTVEEDKEAWTVASFEFLIQHEKFNDEERFILEAFRGQILSKTSNVASFSPKIDILKSTVKEVFEPVNAIVKRLTYPKSSPIINSNIASKKVKVIFYPWLNMHVDFFQNTFLRLKNKGVKSVVFSNNYSIQERLHSLEPVLFDSYECIKETKKLRKAKINILKKSRDIPSFKVGNNHLLFDRLLTEVFELFPRFLETVSSFNQLLKHFPNTKLILVGYDITLVGRTICCLAQKHEIRTATIQHGSNQSTLLKYSIADYNFVFGNYFKNVLDTIAVNNVEVIAVGSPKFEHYFDESYRDQTLKSLDFIKTKNPFLVALSGTGHSISEKNHIATIAVLKKVVTLRDKQHFIFKLHPKDDKRYYEGLIEHENVTVVSRDHRCFEEFEFAEWIKICKGLITGASAAAFEAFILKKNVEFLI